MLQEAESLPESDPQKHERMRAAWDREWVETDITGSHVMNMHIKKGTRALFSDTMYTSALDGSPRGQNELTLDSGGYYRITEVRMDTKGQYVFEVEVL